MEKTAAPKRSGPTGTAARQRTSPAGGGAGGNRLHRLGSMIGNRALSGLIESKYTISSPEDRHERQARHAADRISHAPASRPPSYSLAPAGSGQRPRPAGSPPGGRLPGGGRALPQAERRFFEQHLGADFSDVRVHTGASAGRMAESINARAFTLGRDIVFGEGAFAPGTASGRRLLAHELTHTVQQRNFNDTTTIQRDEDESGGEEEASAAEQVPSGEFNFEPMDLLVHPLIVDIWNDIANHNVSSDVLDEMRLSGTEDAALWNTVLAMPFASASLPAGASFSDWLSAWVEHGDELQSLAGGGTFLLDFFSAFAGVNIEDYLGTDLFVNRLKQHSLSVLSIFAVVQGISSTVAAVSEPDAEEGELASTQVEQQTEIIRGILDLVLKEQFKAPEFFNVGPIRLATHPAYAFQRPVGGEAPSGLTFRHSEGVGEEQGGLRLDLGLTLNIARLLNEDAGDLQQHRGWQGSLWFNYNQFDPTRLQRGEGMLPERDFRAGTIFGGGGFLGLLETGGRFRAGTEESEELTAWFLHGGFGYSGDSASVLRRLGFTATYTDWTEMDVLAPRPTDAGPEAGRAFRFMPFTGLEFDIDERHRVSIGTALGFVTGAHEDFGISDFTGSLSYIYQGDRGEDELPQFRIDLSGSVNRLDWWNPDSPLMTGLQARLGIDRFFLAGQVNLGAGDISEERASRITRFGGETDRFRMSVPTGLLITGGILLGPDAGDRP